MVQSLNATTYHTYGDIAETFLALVRGLRAPREDCRVDGGEKRGLLVQH